MEFDDASLELLKNRTKQQLRGRMRMLRQALPASAVTRRSARIAEKIVALEWFDGADRIALFFPMSRRGEVDLRAVDATARARGKTLYYPFVDSIGPDPDTARAGFRRVNDLTELLERGHAFAEPEPRAPEAAPGELELIIVPALAVTDSGDRLGYGSGYYDRLLPRYCPPAHSIVVAYDFQRLVELPTSPHDVRCDLVVTDGDAR